MMKRKYAFAVFAAFSVAATAAADEGSVKALLDEYVEKGLVAGVVSGISDASGEVRFDCAGCEADRVRHGYHSKLPQ